MSHYRGECSCKCGILDSYQIALLCMRVKISSLCDSSHRWFSLKLISSLLFPFLILIFERSAEYSEFFAMGRDRLVIPGGVLDAAPTIEERPKEKDANPNGNGAGQTPPTLPTPPRHPFIEGLLQTLPGPRKRLVRRRTRKMVADSGQSSST